MNIATYFHGKKFSFPLTFSVNGKFHVKGMEMKQSKKLSVWKLLLSIMFYAIREALSIHYA